MAEDVVNVRDLLDPELRGAFDAWPMPPVDQCIAAGRSAPRPNPPLSDAVTRTEHTVPGDPPVAVRVHRPRGVSGPLPAIVSLHGGGYVVGSYDSGDPLFDDWCPRLGVVGIAVEYRLAPETPYPGPLEDCYTVLRWAYANAEELGLQRDKIGLHGLSAGGGLAAGLALLARDRGEVPVAFQALDCPMLDDRQATGSINAEGLYVWTKAHNELGWRSYLGELHGRDDIPPYAVPARAGDLTGLPPTGIVVGAIDGFADECIDYAQRLTRASVPCDLHVIAGLPHAYRAAPGAAAVRQATRDLDDWIARQIAG